MAKVEEPDYLDTLKAIAERVLAGDNLLRPKPGDRNQAINQRLENKRKL